MIIIIIQNANVFLFEAITNSNNQICHSQMGLSIVLIVSVVVIKLAKIAYCA